MEREQRLTSGTLQPQTEKPITTDAKVTGSPQEALRRRDRITLLLTSMTHQTNKVMVNLEVALSKEDHIVLGYASWTAYLAGEYAGLFADLNMAQRREVVGSLTAIGMSTRAIAPVVGVSRQQVSTDLQVASNLPPGREDEDDVDHRVTGMDGKSYPVPNKPTVGPRKPHRPSLPGQYRAAFRELDKAVRRMEQLHIDNRFTAHRKSLTYLETLVLEHSRKLADLGQQLGSGGAR